LAAIETIDLTRYYGELCAVDHLNLTVQRGELLAFLGPNGAGKTTTIRMLCGLLRPSEGRALIDGIDVVEEPLAAKARIGVVPQRSNLYAELSARENLIFTAKLYGLSRARWGSRADELLRAYDLAERAASPFGALSGGMKRRLTIAAALVHEPSILFLDEPTRGLDVQSARNLRARIETMKREGVTVFLTTHLIQEAERLADRVAIIVRGRLVVVDTPAALRARYRDEEILELRLSTVEEPLLEALRDLPAVRHVTRSGDRVRLVADSLHRALGEAMDLLRGTDVQVRDVQTVTPSLEDAFVRLTDLSLEAMEGAPAGPGGGGHR
jgi:ABC-2 type transport system ATP-binding protein